MVDEISHDAVIRTGEGNAVPFEEPTLCPDCGIDAWRHLEGQRIVREAFYVDHGFWHRAPQLAIAVPR